MLSFLFTLAAVWTLFWFVMLLLDWGDRTPFTDTKALPSKRTNTVTSNTGAATVSASKHPIASNNNTATKKIAPATETKNTGKQTASNKIVLDKHDQANVTPLFEAPNEKDDLKTIKGIGVVMEKTLNDLGITTFKQLAGFKQADVKMVSNVLSEANAGFGDRIRRDEWVHQAKDLVKKAS